MKKSVCILFLIITCQLITSQTSKDTLLIGYRPATPFIIENGNNLEGINVWLWKRIAKRLDLKYKMVPMEFSKMLEALKSGDIDISINPLTITSERSKSFHFTDSFYASNSTIAIIEQSALHELASFLKKFFNVNFFKGIFVLIIIILLFGILSWFFERKRNPQHFRANYRGIWDGLWWAAVTLTTVGYGDKTPKSRKGRVLALILMFGGLLFISGLTASIASNLTVNQLNVEINKFHDFKEQSIGTIKSSSSNEFLREHFFKDITPFNNIDSAISGLMQGEVSALIYDEPILKSKVTNTKGLESIIILPIKFDVQFYAFGLSNERKELEELISLKILEIIESREWEVILNEFGLTEL